MIDQSDDVIRHIVVMCHPESDSFTASVAQAYCAAVHERGHQALIRDLYGMGFHPVLRSPERPGMAFRRFEDVDEELNVIRASDVFVLVYPVWFGSAPAMLKGYVERVLGSGVMPRAVRQGSAAGVLAGKRMVSFTSSASTEEWLDEEGQLDALKAGFDHYIERAFAMKPSQHVHAGSIVSGMEPDMVRAHLDRVRDTAQMIALTVEQERLAARAAATPSVPS